MTGLFGFFGSRTPADELRSVAAHMAPGGQSQGVIVGAHGFVGIWPGAVALGLHSGDGATAAVCGRPRIVAEGDSRAAGTEEAARHVIGEFRSHGPRALASLSGSFSLALADDREGTLLLAIDRIGIEQLHFAQVDGGIAFASSIDLLGRHPRVTRRVSAQALFDYFYFHEVPSPVSIFEGMTRLQPGEFLRWKHPQFELDQHSRLEFDESRSTPFPALKEEFISVLSSAVGDSIAGARCGAFLSGGTDSSTIVGLIARSGAAPVDAYSIGFEAEGYDEMDYARIAARHFGARHHECYVTPDDVVAAVPALARIFDQPFGNSSVVPAYYCARMAHADGVERMIAGDGGDELFGGNTRYATQYVFSLYESLSEPLRRRLLEPLASRLPLGVPPLRKLRRYVEQAAVPMPARTETYNLLNRLGSAQVFAPDLLRRVDTGQPLALQSEAYFNRSARTLINRQLALDIKFTLADNDLPKVSRACELAGLPVAFPMLDPRVIDFSLRLDPRLKLKGTRLRYFFKEALRGFLPDATIVKQKHGFGLPFGPWAVSNPRLHGLAFDSLANLKRRRIFTDALIDGLPARLREHPSYYGGLVWILMMLEQWLMQHAPETDGRNL